MFRSTDIRFQQATYSTPNNGRAGLFLKSLARSGISLVVTKADLGEGNSSSVISRIRSLLK